jgi:RimJ/RimL family protein N-acetyltransferase
MLFRPTVEADLDRVVACTVTEPISSIPADRYPQDDPDWQHRPEWTWIAEDSGQILARAVWSGFAHHDHPWALDCVWVHGSVADRIGLAAELLTAAHQSFRTQGIRELPGYHLRLPVGWRDDAAVAAALAWRQEAATRAGLTEVLERRRYEWTPGAGMPEPTGRLTFAAEPDDEAFLAGFRRVAQGSLDVTTRRNVATIGADQQAREDMDVYRSLPGERDWWRLAFTPDGTLAGLAIPSHSPDGPTVGYLGVVPELRGRGLVDDLLGEITRFHAAAGAEQIRAVTDTTNLPMAAAFERAGYRNTAIWWILSAPSG